MISSRFLGLAFLHFLLYPLKSILQAAIMVDFFKCAWSNHATPLLKVLQRLPSHLEQTNPWRQFLTVPDLPPFGSALNYFSHNLPFSAILFIVPTPVIST
jgi:hypothetical protein